MAFADNYLQKRRLFPDFISSHPNSLLEFIVVIPCYDEPNITQTLDSLKKSAIKSVFVETLVVINSSQTTPDRILEQNRQTQIEIEQWKKAKASEAFQVHVVAVQNLNPKEAGVGLARKIGMDEAIARFNKINNPQGVILSLDADTICDDNYFREVKKFYATNPTAKACTIYYEHPTSGTSFPKEIYRSIMQYELYLRYYIQGLRYANFPYAFHTIGSAFSLKASVYAKQGGMNRRQGGEDFYFLQKIIPLGNFYELNTTKVIPSPRPSARVPFGTGPAVKEIAASGGEYLTYNPLVFKDIRVFLQKKDVLFKIEPHAIDAAFDVFPTMIKDFLRLSDFGNELQKINNNSPNLRIFNYRFFQWFTAFRALKFINFAHENLYRKKAISEAAKVLYDELFEKKLPENVLEQLLEFRRIQKNTPYNFMKQS
ncbi:MAG: family 2 glycosyl transferase [Bacteroidia bacterium]|nr:MAG: family 2 glycosyl transferase [Bacteroidia bacterium]